MASAYALSFCPRSSTGTLDQGLNAALAAVTALSTSSLVDTGTLGFGSVVAGLILCLVLEVEVKRSLMMLWYIWAVSCLCMILNRDGHTLKSSFWACPLTPLVRPLEVAEGAMAVRIGMSVVC